MDVVRGFQNTVNELVTGAKRLVDTHLLHSFSVPVTEDNGSPQRFLITGSFAKNNWSVQKQMLVGQATSHEPLWVSIDAEGRRQKPVTFTTQQMEKFVIANTFSTDGAANMSAREHYQRIKKRYGAFGTPRAEQHYAL